MTHYKIYVIPEKLYTTAYFDEADKLYYICGCSTGYLAEQVIKMHEIEFKYTPCFFCDYIHYTTKPPHKKCSTCDNYTNYKPKTTT